MKKRMASAIACLALGICTESMGTVVSAPLVVDWLEFDGTSAFVDDSGGTLVNLGLTVDSGFLFPGHPARSSLSSAFWLDPPPFSDTMRGDATVSTVSARVGAGAGAPRFRFEFVVTSNTDLILSVGGLFRDSQSATSPVGVTAILGAGGSQLDLEFLGTSTWSNGVEELNNELSWDAGRSELNVAVGSEGESEVAFFRLAADGSEIRGIRVEVLSGYELGAGDSIQVGVGSIIPEPTSVVLLMVASGLLYGRRAR